MKKYKIAIWEEISGFIDVEAESEEKAEELGLAGYDLVHSTCNSKNMVKETLAIYQKLIE